MDANVIAGKLMNMDTHYSLLGDRDILYMLNGDVSGNESNHNSWFAQNQLGNELCYTFPEGYVLNGFVQMNNFEYALFFITDDSNEIGIFNAQTCDYTPWANSPCLNFQNGFPVRGVYKFKNKDNKRRVYFVDGVNPNRFIDIDSDYPKEYTGSKCDTCDVVEIESLDCEAIRMNRCFIPPCGNLERSEQGNLLSGVYQVGIAYGEDNLVLTDYFFTSPIKVWSEVANIGLTLEIDCNDAPFSEYSVVLVSNTRENSLVVYNLGWYSVSNSKITIFSTDNATILSTTEATQKRVVYDTSEHIATNGETLLLGKHTTDEPINYQPLANNIEVKWQEVKVPKEIAYKYPSFMRDEVYALAIEWFDNKGQSRGVFHIPGRASASGDVLPVPTGSDVYETDGCDPAELLTWQVENTAYLLNDYGDTCLACSGSSVAKDGVMGYWEAENLTYPKDHPDKVVFGDLECTPIRHHKFPTNQITHIHDDFTIESVSTGDCETIELYDFDGNSLGSYEYCPPTVDRVIEPGCVNILAMKLENIQHPLDTDLNNDANIVGYRVLVADRQGNKTVLHKGLIYNCWRDQSMRTASASGDVLYPNYPYNDLFPDIYLSTTQTPNNTGGSANDGWVGPKTYSVRDFTYHSPDIHYRETAREFGTELKVYGEETGWLQGAFMRMYKHPQTRLGIGGIGTEAYTDHATQVSSVCNYSKFSPLLSGGSPITYNSRYKVELAQYLLPIKQILSNNVRLNNLYRESSYYVGVNRDMPIPTNKDTSRIVASELGYFANNLPTFDYFDTVNRVGSDPGSPTRNLQGVSYYVGIKVKQPDQYGALEQIKYRPVTCVIDVPVPSPTGDVFYSSDTVYGGDVYITKHSVLRKMPLFENWLYDVPIDTEINYRDNRNVWYPRWWYDNLSTINDQYNLEGFEDREPSSDILAYGKFYTFISGVAYFYCESEFIGDYRERDFTPNGTFYPKASHEDISRSDKIVLDNKYLYNLTLLNNEIERVYQNLNPTLSDAEFVVSYSRKDDFQAGGDPWLQFLPLNYTILPRTYGRFTGLHYTDNYSIFFIFENMILYSQMNYNLKTDQGNSILLAQGDIFTNRLIKLSNESTGYVGSVDPLSFVNTRYGTFFMDRYRKKFFRWNGQLADVTGNLSSWMNNFLADDATDYNTSMVTCFDNFTENIYITEKASRDRWTVSYKPKLEGFISFHSFIPDWYLTLPNSYLTTGVSSLWLHNSKYTYQKYYGNNARFEVGMFINNKFANQEFQSIDVFAEFIDYQGWGSPIYLKSKFFDKIFAYNNNGSTGSLTVLLKDKLNPSQHVVQNSDTNVPAICEVTQVGDSIYRINKLESYRVNPTTQPPISWSLNGTTYTISGVNQSLNPRNRDDLKGKWLRLHLISESNNDKILLQLISPTNDNINI